MLRFHVQTAGSTLTAQQPDVNIVRTALQAMAAVLGGAQSLHTNSRDEALALPTEESARIALRTQQIIAHESGRHQYRRPGGRQRVHRRPDGRHRTRRARLPDSASRKPGGTLRAIETGYIQNEIQNAAYDYQRGVESGERVVVGVNRFQKEEERVVPTFRLDPALETVAGGASARRCAPAAARVPSRRSWRRSERAARGTENLMPPILDAAGVYATVGEISDCLRAVFGEHREV